MARYVGGPCNGLPLPDGLTEPRVCGGITYYSGEGGNYFPAADEGGAVGVAVLGTHGPKAWHDLQLSVNRRLPTALQHARRVNRATMRTLSRRRRVR